MTMININLESRNLKQQNSSIWVYICYLCVCHVNQTITLVDFINLFSNSISLKCNSLKNCCCLFMNEWNIHVRQCGVINSSEHSDRGVLGFYSSAHRLHALSERGGQMFAFFFFFLASPNRLYLHVFCLPSRAHFASVSYKQRLH